MKRVLLFTFYFPPQPEAGALRPSYLAKYLPAFGWEATIITPTIDGLFFKGPASPFPSNQSKKKTGPFWSAVRRASRALRAAIYFPDAAVYWLPTALRQARGALLAQHHHAILSTALPASMHLAAAIIKRDHNLPWIADYRDLWNGNPYRRFGLIRRFLERFLEVVALRDADVVTAVAADMVTPLRRLSPNTRVLVVPNACDPEEWSKVGEIAPSEFSFLYGGRLYAERSPEIFFRAWAALRDHGDAAGLATRFNFFGRDVGLILEMAERFGVSAFVTAHPPVARSAFLKAQRKAAVLLLLLNPEEAMAGEYGSKIYEYAGARRPILALGGPHSVLKDIVEHNGLGVFATDVQSCMNAIRALYSNFEAEVFESTPGTDWHPFTARSLAEHFAAVLDDLSAAPRTGGRPVV